MTWGRWSLRLWRSVRDFCAYRPSSDEVVGLRSSMLAASSARPEAGHPWPAVNQIPAFGRRRGETASGDRGRRAHLPRHGKRGRQTRDGERAKRRPVGDLRKRLGRQQTTGKSSQRRYLAPQVRLEEMSLWFTHHLLQTSAVRPYGDVWRASHRDRSP